MEDFTKSMRFIITFLFFIILLGMFTNEKITYTFLVLVLASMAVLNVDKVKQIMGGLVDG
ncbi:hypothetical protein HQK35_18970 [Bacillus velezensis]|uniref:hypothetical protein n=1 Tax=Bacillus velezensis TaxID=492670 RepID=UPI00156B938A|nr:hypothetical protein [Bacillus velezensis]NRQ87296.1 hypothetical protein [Bacillus velezensis]NRR09938.1 hypothetical protein [Bacillus velezensis]NRR58255.1 hypothetical protein [Bacillus velezensis]NRR71034.1 hypothetical protein [Bacillus velezensis]NRR86220.1 hypothetical protein [Bacillus velezensis]